MGHVEFLLNGQPVRVDQPATYTTLLDFIRARGLTGAKEGCAEGECGACAVALVEADEQTGRCAFRVVNSCLMLLPMAAGGGSQCGYCTPGFVVSLFAEQHRADRTGPCDTMALSGNLCRCTGYRPIRAEGRGQRAKLRADS